MSDTDLQTYYNQAFNFLQSMTIKFTPISDAYNLNITQNLGGTVNENDPTTWKYYLNLTGQYHSTDEVMTIQSLDTQTTIDFTLANLALHPKTKAAYVVGNPYYTNLCARYPAQVDLIKSIVYPVSDIQTAINADNFTILAYGTNFLESVELDVVLYDMNTFIDYATTRWYLDYLSYEDYFYWIFWTFLWQNLFLTIMTSRLKYIKTSYANSFHVWQYLNSYNIGDFRNVLTTDQALWLYRNIDYIRANKGKQATLRLLADNLLSTVGVGLVGKTIYHAVDPTSADCKWIPQIVSQTVPTDTSQWIKLIAPQSVQDIQLELYNNGLDISVEADYIQRQANIMTNTTINILPTKLLEIQQIGLDKKYSGVLCNFIIDTLVYCIINGTYVPTVDFSDPLTGQHILLNGKDALALFYYCSYMSAKETPTNLPTKYQYSCGYKNPILMSTVPTTLTYKGNVYAIENFLDVPDMLSGVVYPQKPITDNTDFDNLVGNLFSILVSHIKMSRATDNRITLKALQHVYDAISLRQTATISLSSDTTYSSWLSDHNFTSMITEYNNSKDMLTNYQTLANAVLAELIPVQNSILARYIDNSDDIATLYNKVKGLFISLCSYNITFLDTERNQQTWILSEKISSDVIGQANTYPLWDDPTLSEGSLEPKTVIPSEYMTVFMTEHSVSAHADNSINYAPTDIESIDPISTVPVHISSLIKYEGQPLSSSTKIRLDYSIGFRVTNS